MRSGKINVGRHLRKSNRSENRREDSVKKLYRVTDAKKKEGRKEGSRSDKEGLVGKK